MKIVQLFFLLISFSVWSQKKFDDLRKKLEISKKYEYVYAFENNLAVFRTFNDKMGVIDTAENVIIKPVFSYINNNKELKNLFEVGNYSAKKFKRGFIDLKGMVKIPLIYDDVFCIDKGLIRVANSDKYGVIDTLNTVILPTKFDFISVDNNVIIAEWKGMHLLFDYKGRQISDLQFTSISNFKANKAIVTFKDGSNAIIDNQANILLKVAADYFVTHILENQLFLIKNKQNNKEGILDFNGNVIIPCKYESIKQFEDLFIAEKNNYFGFITLTDSVVKPFVYNTIFNSKYDDPIAFDDNKFLDNFIVTRNNLYGVINPKLENEVVPIRYKSIRSLNNLYFIVQNSENRNGLYLNTGEKVIDERYVFYATFENTIFATKNNTPFLITLNYKNYSEKEVAVDEFVTLKNTFDYPKSSNQIVKLNGKFGVLNHENKLVIPCVYDYLENIYISNEFIVTINNKFGIVNSDNSVVLPIEYDAFERLKELLLFTKKKPKTKKYHEVKFR